MASSSSARKRPNPSTTQSGRKRQQWSTPLEAGPSGTRNTDTRLRSPERSIFTQWATVPKNLTNLERDDIDRLRLLKRKRAMNIRQGMSVTDAERKFRSEWTQWVEHKYGDFSVMTVDGVDVEAPSVSSAADSYAGPCEYDLKLSDEEEEEEILPSIEPASESFAKQDKALIKLFSENAGDDNGKDGKVCERLYVMFADIQVFAQAFRVRNITASPAEFMDGLMKKENEQLIRYIGCLAIGGKNGKKGWEEILTKPEMREAIVVGILGRALKEHVFSDLWFGGSDNEKKDLMLKQQSMQDNGDGFSRTIERAKLTQKFEKRTDLKEVSHACTLMKVQLDKMLAPFYDGKAKTLPSNMQRGLFNIVESAASLSRFMRLAPDVIYYWPSTFKDEEFEPDRMECYNLYDMIQNSPYEKKTVGGMERAVPRAGASPDETEAIVKIVCFPGIVAYRQGGGSLALEELAQEKARPDYAPPDVKAARKRLARTGNDARDGSEGFRSKTICKSVVYLIWSKQRLLTREAGTSAHIDAMRDGNMDKYAKDYEGFVELFDIFEQTMEKKGKASSGKRSGVLSRQGGDGRLK